MENDQSHQSKEGCFVTLRVVLDTTGNPWTVEWFRNNQSLRGPEAFPEKPEISYVGFTKFIDASGFVDNFSLTIPNPVVANKPNPADLATDVSRDLVLSWTPGEFADKHNVYFGTNFDDVDNAEADSPLLIGPAQDVNNYDVGRLEFGQSYYWRVDEVNSPASPGVFKGEIWSFTVEPLAIPIPGQNIVATASSQ